MRFLIGMLSTKDVAEMLRMIETEAQEIAVVMPPSDKAVDSREMSERIQKESNVTVRAFSTIREGVEYILSAAGADDVICATGSLYSIDEIRKCAKDVWKQEKADPVREERC